MPKKNIPTDAETLTRIAEVPAEAAIERLKERLAAAEQAADKVAELKADGKRPPRALADQAREAPHLAALLDKVVDTPATLQTVASYQLAARITKEASDKAKAARRRRDRELHTLHVRYAVRKVTLYTAYDIGRGKLDKAFIEFPGDVPKKAEFTAWKSADKWHAVYTAAISVEKTAREERNRLGAILESGEDRYEPAELTRLSELTSARVSQLRTGSSNAARARKNRERRKSKTTSGKGGAVQVA